MIRIGFLSKGSIRITIRAIMGGGGVNVGALIIRKGFWGVLYYML